MSSTKRPVVIHDPLRPHTHCAQGMKPYAGITPSFVRAMDQYAEGAGLTKRQLLKRHSPTYGDQLLLVYSGTREQILRCELVANPDTITFPTRNKASTFRPIRLEPSPYATHGNVHKLSAPLYALTVSLTLPRSVTQPFPGVECFDFLTDGGRFGYVAYSGTKKALVSARIAGADMFPDDGSEMEITRPDRRGYDVTLEESAQLHGGVWVYIKHPHAAEELDREAQEEAESRLAAYNNPEEWLERKEDLVCALLDAIFDDESCSVDTKNGMRYSINRAALAEVRNEIEAVVQRIRNIPVRVTTLAPKVTPDALGKATAAAVDGKFLEFMHSLTATQTRSGKQDKT